MVIDELITLLTFKADKGDAERYKEALEAIDDAAKTAAAWVGGLATGLVGFGRIVAGEIAQNYEWAKSNGVNIESMQRMRGVVEAFGGDIDELRSGMENWTRVAQAEGTSIEDLFDRVWDSVKDADAQTQRIAMAAEGIPESYIRAYQQVGKEGVRKLLNETNIVTESQMKASLKFMQTWRQAISAVRQIKDQAISKAMPQLEGLIRKISDFIQKNKQMVSDKVAKFFSIFATVIGAVAAAFFGLIQVVVSAIDWLDRITNGIASSFVIWSFAIFLVTELALALSAKLYIAVVQSIAKVKFLAFQFQYYTYVLIQNIAQSKIYALVQKHGLFNTLRFIIAKQWDIVVEKARLLISRQFWKQLLLNIAATLKSILVIAIKVAKITAELAVTALWIAAQITVKAVMLAVTAAQWLLNTALFACPITWIILGIVAAIAIIALVIKYFDVIVAKLKGMWDWFIKVNLFIVQIVWKTVKSMLSPILWIWNFSKSIVQGFIGIISFVGQKIVAFTEWILESFRMIAPKGGWLDRILGTVLRFLGKVKRAIGGVFDFVKGIYSGIERLFSNMWDSITATATKWLNNLIKLVNKIPGLNISAIGENQEQKAQVGPQNKAGAGVSNVSNNTTSNRSVVINNNNTINTQASSPSGIAGAMNRASELQRANFSYYGYV